MVDEQKRYTVLVLCPPAYGHLNPMASLVNEITKNTNVKVIFFGNAEHRELIEKAKAEFRLCKIDFFDPNKSVNEMRHSFSFSEIMGKYMRIADEMFPIYLRVIEEENIDLIIHDFGAIWARWFLAHMDVLYAKKQMKKKPPKSIMISPSFLFEKDLYPGETEAKFLPKPKLSPGFIFDSMFFMPKYWYFYYKYGIEYVGPMDIIVFSKDKLNLCCVMPEFHPRSHLFSKSTHFVGNYASEDLRAAKALDEPLKSFLAPFEPKNPLPLKDLELDDETFKEINKQPKLIYASFGTLANQDMKAYMSMIEAVKTFDEQSNKSGIKSSQLKLLLSVGQKSYADFQRMIANKELQLPDNVLIMEKVPQLDVLKRASLFITHSGQGSTSEALHYGVPMVCVPVIGDQPLVAYRAADELGLGVRLSIDDFDHIKLRNAMVTIFDDKSYLERSLIMAKLSAKHNGLKTSTEIVMKLLEESSKSKDD